MEVFRIRECIGNLSWIFCSPPERKGIHEAADFFADRLNASFSMGSNRRDDPQRKDVNWGDAN